MPSTSSMDILDYDKPTDEEVGEVLAYWDNVRAQLEMGVRMADTSAPSSDLLVRVAVHQQWQQAMSCQHPSITFGFGEEPKCSDCERPVKHLSDVQIQAFKGV